MKKLIVGILTLLFSFSATAQGPSTYWSVGGALLSFDDGFDTIDPVKCLGDLATISMQILA